MTPEDILKAVADGTIQVISLEECSKSDVHLCASQPTGLKGEQESVCSVCGNPVFFTTVFPEGKQPRKMCVQCANSSALGENSLIA